MSTFNLTFLVAYAYKGFLFEKFSQAFNTVDSGIKPVY